MAIAVKCPGCRTPYQVREQSLGGRAQCKKCGLTFTLEMSADETLQPEATPDRKKSPPLATPLADVKRTGRSMAAAIQPEAQPDAGSLPPTLGHYVIRSKLGEGAMGEVFLAHDPNLDREVAIKVPGQAVQMVRIRTDLDDKVSELPTYVVVTPAESARR